jgi:hypothetical protein
MALTITPEFYPQPVGLAITFSMYMTQTLLSTSSHLY